MMQILDVSGSWYDIGKQTGIAAREAILANLPRFDGRDRDPRFEHRLEIYREVLERHLPEAVEEMQGLADGAGLTFGAIASINLACVDNSLVVRDACTEIVFSDGPDGPLLGKNNDGLTHTPPVPLCRVLRPTGGLAQVQIIFAGFIGLLDGMNEAGVAIGHSSVGSIFQQSDRHLPIRPWGAFGLSRAETTEQFVEHMASVPLRGKGFGIACVDAAGVACAIEAACPLVQVRRPAPGADGLNVVNMYQLPALAHADRRLPGDKCNAEARRDMLDRALAALPTRDIAAMTQLLQRHRHGSDPGICRHEVADDGGITEYSYIAIPKQRRMLLATGAPCQARYMEVNL